MFKNNEEVLTSEDINLNIEKEKLSKSILKLKELLSSRYEKEINAIDSETSNTKKFKLLDDLITEDREKNTEDITKIRININTLNSKKEQLASLNT